MFFNNAFSEETGCGLIHSEFLAFFAVIWEYFISLGWIQFLILVFLHVILTWGFILWALLTYSFSFSPLIWSSFLNPGLMSWSSLKAPSWNQISAPLKASDSAECWVGSAQQGAPLLPGLLRLRLHVARAPPGYRGKRAVLRGTEAENQLFLRAV